MTKKQQRLTEQLQKAKQWAIDNLVGKKVFHPHINNYIEFNSDGISHAIYAKTYPEKIELIYHALERLVV